MRTFEVASPSQPIIIIDDLEICSNIVESTAFEKRSFVIRNVEMVVVIRVWLKDWKIV